MATYKDFLRLVMPELPKCPNIIVGDAVHDVVRDFLNETGIKTVTCSVVGTGITDYVLSEITPTDEIIRFDGLRIAAEPIPPNGVHFAVPVMKGRVLQLAAVVRPRRSDSMVIPDVLLDRWADAIAAGVKFRLMSQVGKEWSNPGQATYYKDEYRRMIGSARVAKMQTMGEMAVRPQPFGGVGL